MAIHAGILCAQAGLRSLIDNAQAAETRIEAQFVDSGLRAAKASRSAHRSAILSDLASVLGCAAGDLDFLFDAPHLAANDRDPIVMPDYRDALCAPTEPLAAE